MKTKRMPALSIQQPWAWAILYAGKDVENRKWKTAFRGRVVIHASKTYDWDGHNWLLNEGYHVPPPDTLPRGANVGEATIVDCVEVNGADRFSAWAFGPFAFLLDDPEPYADPIPQRGALGFFTVEVPA